jgi:1-acyl-sn-glycerol-3-phosphate acyltransferase
MRAANISTLKREITIEILAAFGLPRSEWSQKVFGPFFRKPALKFSTIMAGFDQNLEKYGVPMACKKLLSNFVEKATATGVEGIPKEGPLLIASNHPGTVDGLAIVKNLPREDIKTFSGGMPFLKNLPIASKYLIFSDRDETNVRVYALRKSIRHLEGGGSLLIFPSGQIDPDPHVLPGAREALEKWSRSIALMLRKVPETKLLTTITSGVLAKKFTKSPLTMLKRNGVSKRRIMEFIQMMRQILFSEKLGLKAHVSFAPPLTIDDLGDLKDSNGVMKIVKDRAKQLLQQHMSWISRSEFEE